MRITTEIVKQSNSTLSIQKIMKKKINIATVAILKAFLQFKKGCGCGSSAFLLIRH